MSEEKDPTGAGPGPRPDPAGLERELLEARRRITEADEALVRLIGERRALAVEIGRLKAALGLPVLDPAREAEVVRRAAMRAREAGVDEEMTRDVVWRIIASAREAQQVRDGRAGGGADDAPPPAGKE